MRNRVPNFPQNRSIIQSRYKIIFIPQVGVIIDCYSLQFDPLFTKYMTRRRLGIENGYGDLLLAQEVYNMFWKINWGREVANT